MAQVNFRVDDDLKARAESACADHGHHYLSDEGSQREADPV